MKLKIAIIILTICACTLARNNAWLLVAILALCIAGLFLVDLFERIRRKKQIGELIDYVTKVQNDLELPELQKISEDELGILQSEIYKVVAILKEAYSSEHRQKKYVSDMMSDISHQFKTPLTAISLMSELLIKTDVTEELRLEYAGKVGSQVRKMTWLIKNLLTLSQLEAGVLEMKEEDIDLAEMTADIVESLEVMAEVAGVSLSASVPEKLFVKGDPYWLREALINIVKNCVEHTAEGGFVKISATQNNISTLITIEDNGVGIAPEHLPHIFERFYKAGNDSPNSVGIGLAMARQIILGTGGKIEAFSELGKGTRFEIKLYR
ncbi:MAG: HAMP domain-containing histidine kinase [Lachnospiraceae bacterium]|nr:HAMP domain-containing histidine kinase [Lachnospiraceae bacterium]MBP5264392.1 HAMP domain-containing histidine kinase [Lachnospiraceae bacterium]MBP5733861.1 HAMP domain-containing histidine kinase [Lachnospiraceae bacterium]